MSLFSLVFLSLLASSAQSPNCDRVLNRTVQLAAADYRLPMGRDTEVYRVLLGKEFRTRLARVNETHSVLDIGGGLGLFGLNMAVYAGRSIVINAQDFQALFQEEDPEASRQPGLTDGKYGLVERAYPYVKDWPQIKGLFARNVAHHTERGRFDYKVGLAENILPNLDVQAFVLTDVFGAFFYSADRMHLLEIYYAKLAQRGMGFIATATKGFALRDVVVLKDQRRNDLIEFLISEYPTVFKRSEDQPFVLIMKRQPNIARLDLSSRFRRTQTRFRGGVDLQVPVSEWHARP